MEEMHRTATHRVNGGRQAAKEVWTFEDRLAALRSGTDEDHMRAIIDAGILDENGNLTPLYAEDWGDRVTRTLDYGV